MTQEKNPSMLQKNQNKRKVFILKGHPSILVKNEYQRFTHNYFMVYFKLLVRYVNGGTLRSSFHKFLLHISSMKIEHPISKYPCRDKSPNYLTLIKCAIFTTLDALCQWTRGQLTIRHCAVKDCRASIRFSIIGGLRTTCTPPRHDIPRRCTLGGSLFRHICSLYLVPILRHLSHHTYTTSMAGGFYPYHLPNQHRREQCHCLTNLSTLRLL